MIFRYKLLPISIKPSFLLIFKLHSPMPSQKTIQNSNAQKSRIQLQSVDIITTHSFTRKSRI